MFIKHLIEYAKYRLMQHTVSHAGFVNMSSFWVGNEKIPIRIVNIRLWNKLLMKTKQIVFKMKFKLSNISLF